MNDSDRTFVTSGAGFADNALPFEDLKEDAELPFVEQNGIICLRGSRSRSSGSLAFPVRDVCLETGARDMEPFLFGPKGVLYSSTTVHVSSTRPTPYSIGYVDFPNGVRVLAHIEGSALDESIACDQAVELRADGTRWFVVPVVSQSGV